MRDPKKPYERIGPGLETVNVLRYVDDRQHRQAVGVTRRLLDGALQVVPRHDVLLRRDPLEITKAVEQRLVGSQLIGALAAHSFAHAVRQNTVGIGDRGNDARDDVTLQLENGRAKGAIIGLGPQMRSGIRVHELHRDAHLRARLAQAPFHHVASAKRFSGGADVEQFVRISRIGTASDHAEVGET